MRHSAGRLAGAGLCLLLAAMLLVLSQSLAIEAENPDEFPGIRDNNAVFVLAAVGLAVLGIGGAVFITRRAGRTALTVVAVLAAVLVVVGAYRIYTLAPMLECSTNSVAREADGSYTCYDR
ncbi:hypothetical protein G5C51_31800 [Streptomyces sp. A7024]|uniref:Uncharacterized protein n=1 Tax=Streptomyces coryli TaxID=1128680 RepID=A0A6G4U8A9_9ACTN|nr:hypothetical protein [Streptomyces coryli]NGN68469.1 hypothetical protein [Streptomyces coryli]